MSLAGMGSNKEFWGHHIYLLLHPSVRSSCQIGMGTRNGNHEEHDALFFKELNAGLVSNVRLIFCHNPTWMN